MVVYDSEDDDDDNESARQILRQAVNYFERSVGLVNELESLNEAAPGDSSVDDDHGRERRTRTRSLWLCRGRALANLGRATHELGSSSIGNASSSLERLRGAVDAARVLREMSVEDVDGGETAARVHRIDADGLEATSLRWTAEILGGVEGRRDEALEILRSVVHGNDGGDTVENRDDDAVVHGTGQKEGGGSDGSEDLILAAKVRLLAERYHCASAMVDLLTERIELLSSGTRRGVDNNLDALGRAFDAAGKIRALTAARDNDPVARHGVQPSDDVCCVAYFEHAQLALFAHSNCATTLTPGRGVLTTTTTLTDNRNKENSTPTRLSRRAYLSPPPTHP